MTKAQRLLLQSELEGYLEGSVETPSDHVSFQPNEESKIPYPHIVYSLDPAYKIQADNISYFHRDKYEATYIDREPDSTVFDELKKRTYTSHKASFVVDGLYHYVFDLYQ